MRWVRQPAAGGFSDPRKPYSNARFSASCDVTSTRRPRRAGSPDIRPARRGPRQGACARRRERAQGIEAARTGVGRGQEVGRKIDLKTTRVRHGDGLGVVVHPHPCAPEMVKIASESAADIEDAGAGPGGLEGIGVARVKGGIPISQDVGIGFIAAVGILMAHGPGRIRRAAVWGDQCVGTRRCPTFRAAG